MTKRNLFLTGKRLTRFEAVQHVLVPRSKRFTNEERQRGIVLVNDLLAEKSKVIHFKLHLFLIFIAVASRITTGRAFSRLSNSRQKRVLDLFFDSPVPLFRKGFWGLNTLAKLSVFGQHQLYGEFGYDIRSNQPI